MIRNTSQTLKRTLIRRIIFDLFFVIVSYIAPWWVLCLLTVAGVFLFGFFWEGVLYAVIIDSVFGVASARFWGISYFFTLIMIIVVTGSLIIRKSTRMYGI